MTKVCMIAVIALLGLAAGAYVLGAKASLWHSRNADCEDNYPISTSSLDIGSVWEKQQFEFVVDLKNTGSIELDVAEIVTSCSCGQVQPQRFSLPAGETRQIVFTLDLVKNGSDFEVPIEVSFTPIIASHRPKTFTLTGVVLRPYVAAIHGVTFRSPIPFGKVTVERTKCKVHPSKLSKLSVTCDNPYLTASLDEAKGQLVVVADAALPRGTFFSKVLFFDKDAGRSLSAIQVSGKVVDRLYSVPDVLVLGRQKLGTAVNEMVLLKSARNTDKFRVVECRTQDPALNCAAASKEFSESHSLNISQEIDRIGAVAGEYVVVVEFEDGARMAFPLRISFEGSE